MWLINALRLEAVRRQRCRTVQGGRKGEETQSTAEERSARGLLQLSEFPVRCSLTHTLSHTDSLPPSPARSRSFSRCGYRTRLTCMCYALRRTFLSAIWFSPMGAGGCECYARAEMCA